jgi:nuclear-control-of-ATPase protein 2
MSFVVEYAWRNVLCEPADLCNSHVRHIDSHFDRLHFSKVPHAPLSPVISSANASGNHAETTDVARAVQLQLAIKSLSITPSSRTILPSARIQSILEHSQPLGVSASTGYRGQASPYEQELEWLLLSKATAQTYGLILDTLLDQTIPLNSDMWYWDEVLGSYINTSLYYIQTSPWRLLKWSNEVYQEAWRRFQATVHSDRSVTADTIPVSARWRRFYGLVKDTVRDRSLADIQSRVISPLNLCREEARSHRRQLRRYREMNACGLGVLMNEGLQFDVDDDGSIVSKGRSEDEREEWKTIVLKSVVLMETTIRQVTAVGMGLSEFEDSVFASVENDPELSPRNSDDGQTSSSVITLANRLQNILQVHVPEQARKSATLTATYGRPSRVVRYWLPATALFLSSSTLVRIVINRKADIIAWVRDLGTTSIDFWYNWVVEPVKRILGTIRHDKDSEIAIMSKESLEGDRASLERMVVEFAKDIPDTAGGASLGDVELAKVRAKVREGDLTPVLRAYENDLRNPFIGTVRGNLIRALLIQIQKTKVDVEVAMSGIDALLKSQELVFGFVVLVVLVHLHR